MEGEFRLSGGNDMLKGKTVILGVTGGIAASKAAYLTSALVKLHMGVELYKCRGKIGSLIGGNSAGDTQNYGFSFQHIISS